MSLLTFELSLALFIWTTRWPSCSTTVKSYVGLPQSCFCQPGGMPLAPTGDRRPVLDDNDVRCQGHRGDEHAGKRDHPDSQPTPHAVHSPPRAAAAGHAP